MSTWQLLCNRELYSNTEAESIDEIIDTVNLRTNKYEEAHTYFRLRKNLDNDVFNKLFIVKEYIKPKERIGNVKWWRDESTKLDDF